MLEVIFFFPWKHPCWRNLPTGHLVAVQTCCKASLGDPVSQSRKRPVTHLHWISPASWISCTCLQSLPCLVKHPAKWHVKVTFFMPGISENPSLHSAVIWLDVEFLLKIVFPQYHEGIPPSSAAAEKLDSTGTQAPWMCPNYYHHVTKHPWN